MASEQLPITEQDILNQVTALGGDVTPDVEMLAATAANRLRLHGVHRNADGRKVDEEQLKKAGAATKILETLQASTSALDQRMQHAAEPEVVEAKKKVAAIRKMALAVKAAVSILLGNLDDPAINLVRG
ncbi:MAG: hypothetical protein PHO92_05410 [Candidatus Peribacteraceae bacterium]|nr:hypothetical protein [Candidatus Peribacteraceae bacterium]